MRRRESEEAARFAGRVERSGLLRSSGRREPGGVDWPRPDVPPFDRVAFGMVTGGHRSGRGDG